MEVDSVLASVAESVREQRTRLGMTLEQLASLADLSTAHLSRIESGDRQPSLGALIGIARALDVSVSALLGERTEGLALSVYPASPPTHTVNGLAISGLSGFRGSAMLEALRIAISPDREPPGYSSHRGEEWIYVLSGTLRLECGEETHLLEAGCSAHFDAEQPHRLGADGTTVEALVIAADSLKELYVHPLFTSKSLVH